LLETDLTLWAPTEAGSPVVAPEIDRAGFRRVMGSWLSGVSVVSSMAYDQPFGLTCSAICSVSVTPPLLLACINSSSATLAAIVGAGAFTVSVLDTDSRAVSEMFAGRGHQQFACISWHRGHRTGMPVLAAALAYAECTVHHVSEAGDHTIVLGKVIDGATDHTRDPLGYWRTNYLHLPDAIELHGRPDTNTAWIGEL
jgi:flavin reductase (DIM6/NTAB) family NADH-FMN oxidoreductase RutF